MFIYQILIMVWEATLLWQKLCLLSPNIFCLHLNQKFTHHTLSKQTSTILFAILNVNLVCRTNHFFNMCCRGPLESKKFICTISLYRQQGIMLTQHINASFFNKPCFNTSILTIYWPLLLQFIHHMCSTLNNSSLQITINFGIVSNSC